MQILNNENISQSVLDFINSNYPLKKIAFFVDENENNKTLIRNIQKNLSNLQIENSTLTEDVAFCVVCGDYCFQQESLKQIVSKNIPYGFLITNLSASSFLTPHLQNEEIFQIYEPKFTFFDKNSIKIQNFSSNLAVISFIFSRRITVFEYEFYARIFNKNYLLECKNKLNYICDLMNGVMNYKLKNVEQANLKVLDIVVKYLKFQQKYCFLSESNTVFKFANALTKNIFTNVYENLFIASVFSTSLLQKYFSLSFQNNYDFDYIKQLKHCNDEFSENINEFQNSKVSNTLNYKLFVNKSYFRQELNFISAKYFLNKYDFLCVFDDFGFKLTKILQNCDFKSCILKVANCESENLFKQIRNFGMLDF